MPNRHQLQNSNLKETEYELVCLCIHNVCFCACLRWWCAMMRFHSSLSESVYLHVPTSQDAAAPSKQLVVSSDLPPRPPPLPPPTSCSLAVRSHLSFLLLSILFPSPSLLFFHFHLHSLSSFLLSLAVANVFPWWWAKARHSSSFCSCWSPASSNSPGTRPKLSSRLLIFQPWTVLSSLFSLFPLQRSSPYSFLSSFLEKKFLSFHILMIVGNDFLWKHVLTL